jgi:HEAT repeat protein
VWRRFGDVAFAAMAGFAITVEALALAALTWVILWGLVTGAGLPRLGAVALGAAAATSLSLIVISGYLIAYQHVSDRRASGSAGHRHRWVRRWLRVLDGSEAPPTPPLDEDAIEALLGLRNAVRGTMADGVSELLARYDVGGSLVRAAQGRRVSSRLEALGSLARSRSPEAMPALVEAIGDPERTVRIAAARAAARTLAAIDDPLERRSAVRDVVDALDHERMPFGVLEEMLLLADEAAPSVVEDLLLYKDVPAPFRRAALDAVARLQLIEFADDTVRYLDHRDPEVRAAALRAVARMGLLPPAGRPAVLAALEDEVDFIRIHATSAARLLPRDRASAALWDRLGDPSWWVRRAAVDALASLGPAGLAELGRAGRSHPDRYARDMAAQALRDHVSDLIEALAV